LTLQSFCNWRSASKYPKNYFHYLKNGPTSCIILTFTVSVCPSIRM
jgi:hypothetical protein